MKKTVLMLSVAVGLALSSTPSYAKSQPKKKAPQSAFVCENGDQATITYLSEDAVEVSLKYDTTKPKKVRLQRVAGASGERFAASKGFFGWGATWHEKGGEANLSYNTQEGEVSVACQRKEDAERPTKTETVVFKCENGDRATIVYMGKKGIELSLEYDVGAPKTVRLKHAKAASGALYRAKKGFFGWGAQWHEKNGEANLRYNTEDGMVEVICKAQ